MNYFLRKLQVLHLCYIRLNLTARMKELAWPTPYVAQCNIIECLNPQTQFVARSLVFN